METMRSPSFLTPFSRSSHSSRHDGDPASLIHSSIDLLGHMRLEDPHGAAGRRRWPAVPWPLLPYCSRFCQRHASGFVVMLPDAVIELARKAADDGLVAGVGQAQSAAGEPAQVLLRADHEHGLAHRLACTAAVMAPEVQP